MEKIARALNAFLRLFQINDVDLAPFPEDELFHLGIPARGLVTEMHSCFQKLFN
jgi:hypothetical protein